MPDKKPDKPANKKVGDIALDSGLPADPMAERLILGGLLVGSPIDKVREILTPADFSGTANNRIYDRMLHLADSGSAVDRITLSSALVKAGWLESIGGLTYLVELDRGMPEVADIAGYARIVRDRSIERQTIQLAATYAKRLLLRTGDVREVLAQGAASFFDLQHRIDSDSKTVFTPEEVIVAEGMDAVYRPWMNTPGIPTGFETLDDKLGGGLLPGHVICIAGETSNGKTALAGNIALNLAKGEYPVLYLSSEMSKLDMIHRLAAAHCGLSYTRFRRGWLRDEELLVFAHAITGVSQMPFYTDQTTPLTIHDLEMRATRMVRDKGVRVVIVDYIQLMDLRRSGDGLIFREEREALTYISGIFVKLAKTLKVPLVFLSQFSRAKRTRDKNDRKPKESDLFGSSALGNNSSVILAIYRQEFDRPNVEELRNTGTLIVLKNRQGPRGEIELDFSPGPMRFTEKPVISGTQSDA